MKKQGKFLLFETVNEFAAWLDTNSFNRKIRLIQNHHTWNPNYSAFTGNNHFALLEEMETSHLQRGFAEIAQNLTTFPDGSIAVCRSMEKIPAGIKGANTEAICIENLGNFDVQQDQMTAAHRACIIRLNAWLCRTFSIKPTTISMIYHHWWDLERGIRTDGTGVTKSCPGTAFFGGNTVAIARAKFIPHIRRALNALGGLRNTGLVPLYAAEVMAETLTVRAQPKAAATRIKQLSKGIIVEVFAEHDHWRRIHPTEQHWASARFLREAETIN